MRRNWKNWLKDITLKMANDFVNAKFAVVTEQDVKEKPAKPKRG